MSQSRVKFDRKHTNEEKLLRGKYQRLREKKEQLNLYEGRMAEEKLMKQNRGTSDVFQTPKKEAREKVANLLKLGKIHIRHPDEKKRSFKRPAVLEKRLAEGYSPSLGLAGLAFKQKSDGQGAKKETNFDTKGFLVEAARYQQDSSMLPAPRSTAALAERPIKMEQKKRHKSAGGYVDYKRRCMYKSDSSDDDDE